jgi:hypothetical protein
MFDLLRRTFKQLLAAGILAGLAQPAMADLWSGFYTSSAPAPKATPAAQPSTRPAKTNSALCLSAILAAEEKYNIPDHLLLSIGIQEAGRNSTDGLTVWPWTVNAAGEGVFFSNREDAQDWVRQKQAQGVNSIDVGCMQVNLRWHGAQFASQDAAFDPQQNVDYAARFLLGLYQSTGDWKTAAGRYHSATQEHHDRYLASLARNQQVVFSSLDRLRGLAGRVNPVQITRSLRPKLPPPPVFWGGEAEGTTYSIYSNAPIQPVLPAFLNSPES